MVNFDREYQIGGCMLNCNTQTKRMNM